MTYTTMDFGKELAAEINNGYDPIRIAKWAFSRLMDPDAKVESQELRKIILQVVAMEEGPECVMSEEKLRAIAQRLTAGR